MHTPKPPSSTCRSQHQRVLLMNTGPIVILPDIAVALCLLKRCCAIGGLSSYLEWLLLILIMWSWNWHLKLLLLHQLLLLVLLFRTYSTSTLFNVLDQACISIFSCPLLWSQGVFGSYFGCQSICSVQWKLLACLRLNAELNLHIVSFTEIKSLKRAACHFVRFRSQRVIIVLYMGFSLVGITLILLVTLNLLTMTMLLYFAQLQYFIKQPVFIHLRCDSGLL